MLETFLAWVNKNIKPWKSWQTKICNYFLGHPFTLLVGATNTPSTYFQNHLSEPSIDLLCAVCDFFVQQIITRPLASLTCYISIWHLKWRKHSEYSFTRSSHLLNYNNSAIEVIRLCQIRLQVKYSTWDSVFTSWKMSWPIDFISRRHIGSDLEKTSLSFKDLEIHKKKINQSNWSIIA